MTPIVTHRDYFVAVTQEGGGPDCELSPNFGDGRAGQAAAVMG
jgi:hypothetical protein